MVVEVIEEGAFFLYIVNQVYIARRKRRRGFRLLLIPVMGSF